MSPPAAHVPIPRRRFLAGAAGLAGILATHSAPALLRRRSPNEVIRVGLFGCGGRGMQHLKALGYLNAADPRYRNEVGLQPRLEEVEVVAVCDAFEDHVGFGVEAVEAGGGEATPYLDYRELLEAEQIDAVLIATPDHLHVPMAIAAMESGRDVYVEKCMSNSIQGTNGLGEVAKRTGRIVQVGHQRRQDVMHELARSIIERGDLGEVTLVQAFLSRGGEASAWIRRMSHDGGPPPEKVHWDLFLGPAPQRPYDPRRYFEWRRYWDYSTGIAGDLMSHDLDTIHTVMGLGLPHSATASGGVYYWKDGRETPDTYSAILEYPDHDLQVTYSCNLHSNYHKRATLFLGSDATMELSWDLKVYASAGSKKYAEQLKSGEIKLGQPFVKIGTQRGEVITTAAPSELWLENQGLLTTVRDGQTLDVTREHHRDFYACMRDRSEPVASFDEVYGPTIATHMSTEAYRLGRRVSWDPEARKAV